MISYAKILGIGLLLIMVSGSNAYAQTERDPIAGLWYTQDKDGGIEIYSCDKKICGRFYWLKDQSDNGDISYDVKNPDPSKRARPLCGLTFMTGFTPDGKGNYNDGLIYSPRHGADFNAEMQLIDSDTLNLHGYMMFSFLGESQTWKRTTDMPKCSANKRADNK